MRIFNYTKKTDYDGMGFPKDYKKDDEMFIFCLTHEVGILCEVFGFDKSTLTDCTDLDESIRFTGFGGYDFVSMVHAEPEENGLILREINLYVSVNYLVLVMPEHDSPRLSQMEKSILGLAKTMEDKTGRICGLYYSVFNKLLGDFSDTLEKLEDCMQELSDEIVSNVSRVELKKINSLRNMTYTVKKQLRALSYLFELILLDENKIIGKEHLYYFKNINTRFRKLHDFAESLYNLGREMLHTYDSKLTIKTNDTINKLTVVTLFFAPLTLITGIYGMNFENMPELKLSFGYPLAITAMLCISFLLFLFFKKKNWL